MEYGYFDDENQRIRHHQSQDAGQVDQLCRHPGLWRLCGSHRRGADLQGRPGPEPHHQSTSPSCPVREFKGDDPLSADSSRSDGYQVFSPFFVPTLDAYDRYECHVGLGYTRIVSEFYGIRTEVTIFVPLGDSVLMRDIRITNISDGPAGDRRHPRGRVHPFRRAQAVHQRRLGAADHAEPGVTEDSGGLQGPGPVCLYAQGFGRQLFHLQPAGLLLRDGPRPVPGRQRVRHLGQPAQPARGRVGQP